MLCRASRSVRRLMAIASREPGRVVGQDDGVRRLGGDAAAAAGERDADRGAAQRRRVVGTVAHHQHPLTLLHQRAGRTRPSAPGSRSPCASSMPTACADRRGVGLVVAREEQRCGARRAGGASARKLGDSGPEPVGVLDHARRRARRPRRRRGARRPPSAASAEREARLRHRDAGAATNAQPPTVTHAPSDLAGHALRRAPR